LQVVGKQESRFASHETALFSLRTPAH